jgi:hypothetical protein
MVGVRRGIIEIQELETAGDEIERTGLETAGELNWNRLKRRQ